MPSPIESKIQHLENALRSLISMKLKLNFTEYQQLLLRLLDDTNPEAEQESAHEGITVPLYHMAKDWNDILALNVLFVRGLLPSTPSHKRPLYLDSQTQKAQLETVTKLGAMTYDSQPGMCDAQERQRQYVDFFVNRQSIDPTALFNRLAQENVIVNVAMADKTLSNATERLKAWTSINATAQFAPFNDTSYLVAKDGIKVVPMTIDLLNGAWESVTNLRLDGKERKFALANWDWYAKAAPQLRVNQDDVVGVKVVQGRFCQQNIFDIVEKALRDVTRNVEVLPVPPATSPREVSGGPVQSPGSYVAPPSSSPFASFAQKLSNVDLSNPVQREAYTRFLGRRTRRRSIHRKSSRARSRRQSRSGLRSRSRSRRNKQVRKRRGSVSRRRTQTQKGRR